MVNKFCLHNFSSHDVPKLMTWRKFFGRGETSKRVDRSLLMSLEVQIGKNLPSSQKLQLWTSKDIKPLTKIKIIFLVSLSAFIFLLMMSASSISEHFHILTWIPNGHYWRCNFFSQKFCKKSAVRFFGEFWAIILPIWQFSHQKIAN